MKRKIDVWENNRNRLTKSAAKVPWQPPHHSLYPEVSRSIAKITLLILLPRPQGVSSGFFSPTVSVVLVSVSTGFFSPNVSVGKKHL